MFKLIRAAAARAQELLENSKAPQRYAVILPVQVQVAAAIKRQSPPVLNGCTLDMSERRLGLSLPAVHLGGKTLADNKFQVVLQATSGTIVLEVVTACYERAADDKSYRFDVQIQNLASKDYARYQEYLNSVSLQTPKSKNESLSKQALKAA